MFNGNNLPSCFLDALVNYSKAATCMRLISFARLRRGAGEDGVLLTAKFLEDLVVACDSFVRRRHVAGNRERNAPAM